MLMSLTSSVHMYGMPSPPPRSRNLCCLSLVLECCSMHALDGWKMLLSDFRQNCGMALPCSHVKHAAARVAMQSDHCICAVIHSKYA